ncbi:MAG: response regulator transcription factor [Bacteroidetes bacterium]|nr:response regulator transcription factor [Bacteroidota bacterium]MBU1677932.1 response regulator transcription factor [Bacteroidota bacterium]
MKKILIIEDDPAIAKGLSILLKANNYDVIITEDGLGGYNAAKKERYDLIILDLILPDKDGIDICRDLRFEGINSQILMLTSRKEELDKVLGLEIGADDYVTKPFSERELLARIRALLRRTGNIESEINEFSFGNVYIDFKKQEAAKSNQELKLSSKEFKILKYFILREGEIISRDQLLDEVWGYDTYPTTRTVDNYILSLRKAIEDDPSDPIHIITVHKAGYKFVR